jgi:hypothetical protein
MRKGRCRCIACESRCDQRRSEHPRAPIFPFNLRKIILQSAGWGHLHDFLIEDELRDGRLLSIAGRHLKGGQREITAARRRDLPHGPIANRLWQHIAERAATFTVTRRE